MTFALAARSPWTLNSPTTNGLIFVADCRLTGEELKTGRRAVISDSETKIFELGPYAVGAYAGNQVSAGFAMRRVAPLFAKAKKQPGSDLMFSRVAKVMHEGARQAQRYARFKRQPFLGGSFIALFGFIDRLSRTNLLLCGGGSPDDQFWFGGFAPAGVDLGLETSRGLIVGTGAGSTLDYFSHVAEVVGRQAEEDLPHQAAYLSRGLINLLKERPPPDCGGGVQLVTLDGHNGVVPWMLWSTPNAGFAMIPDGKWRRDEWQVGSDWMPARRPSLTVYRNRSFPTDL